MDLNWGNKNNENLEFPPKYWAYNINDYSQFSQGDHSVTKAFEHYLGLTDDYDFCMGPEEEGQPLEGDEFTQRLWGVYAQTAGEIYLLKSRKDYIGWEEEIRLTHAPSGSRKPNIIFDKNGHYRIVLEITPAGGHPEVWLMEYPYTGSAVRKLFNGSNPVIIRDFYDDIYIFYQPNDNKTQIEYRSSKDDYETTYVADRTVSEREVEPLAAFPVKIDSTNHIALFYYRKDDWQPIKYCITSPVVFPTEIMNTNLEVQINWEEYSFDVSFLVVNMFTQEPIEGAEVVFANKTVTTGTDGIAEFPNIGGDYTLVEINHPDYDNSNFNVTITKDTQIIVELLGDIELNEEINTDMDLNIEWQDMRRTVTFEITDGENPIEGAVVNIDNQEKITDLNGIVTFENVIAGECSFIVNAEGFAEIDSTIIVNEDKIVEVELEPDFDGHLIEQVDTDVEVDISWEDTRSTVVFELVNENNNKLEDVLVSLGEYQDTTDSEGKVIFSSIPQDEYQLVIDLESYFLIDAFITVEGDFTTQIILVEKQNTNLKETLQVGVDTSILWLEVEE